MTVHLLADHLVDIKKPASEGPVASTTPCKEHWGGGLESWPELAESVWVVTSLNVCVEKRLSSGNASYGALATGMHYFAQGCQLDKASCVDLGIIHRHIYR
jgi:hypothetical protein